MVVISYKFLFSNKIENFFEMCLIPVEYFEPSPEFRKIPCASKLFIIVVQWVIQVVCEGIANNRTLVMAI